MQDNIFKHFYFCSMTVILLCLCTGVAHAGGQSSTNYTIESDVVSGGGGESGSAKYFTEHTTGQSSAIGESASDNYVNHAGFWYTVPPVVVDDFDGDGIPDSIDNCREVYNPDQEDSNGEEDDNSALAGVQHYGNVCDADYSNNGFVGLEDFNELRTWFGKAVPPAPAYIDCDGDNFIGLSDFNCLRTYFGKAPGPGIGD